MKLVNTDSMVTLNLTKVNENKKPNFLYYEPKRLLMVVDGESCATAANLASTSKYGYVQIKSDWYYFASEDLVRNIRAMKLVAGTWTSDMSKVRALPATKRLVKTPAPKPIAKPRTAKERRQGFSPVLYNSDIAKQERNDCIVRAVMECMGIHYDEAHRLVMETGCRAPKKGTFTATMMRTSPFFCRRFLNKVSMMGMTVAQFLESNPKGNYIVCVKRHGFAVRDGIVIDNVVRPRQRIYNVFEYIGG